MTNYWSSPLLSRTGAVIGAGPDAGVAAHYGDPLREQRQFDQGTALADLSHLGVVTVSGPDRLSWLHSITTANLEHLAPDVAVDAMVLSPKGHIEFVAQIVDDGQTTWLVTEADKHSNLAQWLETMRFLRRVEVCDRTDTVAVVGSKATGEAQPRTARAAALTVIDDPWPNIIPGGTRYTTIDEEAHPGREFGLRLTVVRRDELDTVVGQTALAGIWALEALRIAAWRPRQAREVDHRALPHELDWLRTAVHLNKGCYRGQEAVARIHNMGRPPRRLAFVHLDGSGHELPEPGAAIAIAGREVGTLTSAALHYELGPIGLALLKRNTPADAVLEVAGIAAAQEVIVGVDGVSADRPAARQPIPRGASKPRPSLDRAEATTDTRSGTESMPAADLPSRTEAAAPGEL